MVRHLGNQKLPDNKELQLPLDKNRALKMIISSYFDIESKISYKKSKQTYQLIDILVTKAHFLVD